MDFSELPLTATHKPDGILIVSGSGVRAGGTIHRAGIVDVAPTILRLMGLPRPAYMDGVVLENAFQEGELSKIADPGIAMAAPLDEEIIYTPEEAEKISQHLKDLGYL